MLALKAHRATLRNLPSLYLGQAAEDLPEEGPVVGRDAISGRLVCFDPFSLYPRYLTNPNVLVLGQLGAGKSTLAKLLCWTQRTLLGRAVSILDPKGEYGALADVLDLTSVCLAPGGAERLDPLEPASQIESQADLARRRAEVTASLASSCLGRSLSPSEQAAVSAACEELAREALLAEVVELLLSPSPSMARTLRSGPSSLSLETRGAALALRELAGGALSGMFDGRSTIGRSHECGGVHVDLSAVYRSPAALAPTMVAAGSWLKEMLARRGQQHVLVLDETWQVLSDPGAARWLRQTMKLSRALGVSVVLVTHRIGDFEAVGEEGSEAARIAASLVEDTAARAIFAEHDAAVPETAASLGLSDAEAELLPRLRRGRALWHLGEHVALLDHFVPQALTEALDTDTEMRTSR